MSSTLFVVEIRSWDWPLHVGVRPRPASAERGLDDDLMCVETIAIEGLVLEPQEHRSKVIHIGLLPLPRDVIFRDRDERDVGSLYTEHEEHKDLDFSANLFLPEDTLQRVIFCLGSIWRQIHMWIDDDAEPQSVIHFGFSAEAPADPTGEA
ncbi:hypothetical protein [Phenylobacterium kunshanense]|uniref:Uncharacterized protein n=1 Tax=Phenylobacterium kunshanense TaxID=1445034 RepID=A0A328BD60_9CAUL|nr:hypothetical protein [Phenylobacterium kunshanense]RAK63028.1 hypothetical protein DJ019_17295 [Phenylobacterium kunshanense]